MENATEIIKLFGGVTNMSRELGHKHCTTVFSWKQKNKIPRWREYEIEAAAKRLKIKLPESA